MEIGKIGGVNNLNNLVDNAKNKVEDKSFEEELNNALKSKDDASLKKVCSDFESILLNMMYKQMKSSIPKSELIPQDAAQDVYESMLDEKLVEQAVESGGIGLADMLYKQLSKQKATGDGS